MLNADLAYNVTLRRMARTHPRPSLPSFAMVPMKIFLFKIVPAIVVASILIIAGSLGEIYLWWTFGFFFTLMAVWAIYRHWMSRRAIRRWALQRNFTMNRAAKAHAFINLSPDTPPYINFEIFEVELTSDGGTFQEDLTITSIYGLWAFEAYGHEEEE